MVILPVHVLLLVTATVLAEVVEYAIPSTVNVVCAKMPVTNIRNTQVVISFFIAV